MPVELGGILGSRLELRGLLKGVSDRVSYTIGDTVSARKTILNPPSIICINGTLYEI